MKNLRSLVSVSLTVAVVAIGMALTASTAQAANIVFTVDEGAIPGATDTNVTADGLTAKYIEQVSLGPGTFSANIIVQFTDYTLGNPTVSSQLDPAVQGGETSNTNLYAMYGLVTVQGSFTVEVADGADGDALPGDGNTIYHFHPLTATADLYVDPLRDTTLASPGNNSDDLHILTAGTLFTVASNGTVEICTDAALCTGTYPGTNPPINVFGSVLSGSYALFFTDPTLVNPDGPLYWPTLGNYLVLTATASGDVDPATEGSDFPSNVRGDTSIHFNGIPGTTVPEPASLLLLGGGLLGLAARRRRSMKK